MKKYIALLGTLLLACNSMAEYHFPIGEKAIYKIKWGLLSCGTSTISCDEVELEGKKLIRVRVRAKSNWMVSTVYPVDDTIDCFIDPETQQSVRLEKDTSEGDHIDKDVLHINRQTNTVFWDSTSDNMSTNYPIEAGACDPVTFLYAFRSDTFKQGDSKTFKLIVDAAMHGITITAGKTDKKKIGNGKKVRCREYRVIPERDDLFVRKIPEVIWLTDDDRKIMARMDVKFPVGTARIVLDEYIPGTQP